MRLRFALALVFVFPALALAVVALVGNRASQRFINQSVGHQADKNSAGLRVPVLVELFTSEGCSSCPPADELLMRLEKTQPVAGAEIIALSEHVDYWNRLGWTDPYSSADFSNRQNDYARIFQSDEVYTPQMIVDGRTQFVGNSAAKAGEAIEESVRDPKAIVTIGIAQPDQGDSMTLEIQVTGLLEVSKGRAADVLLAITESGLRSNVAAGENRGRQLVHTAVVRKLSRVGSIDPRKDGTFTAQPVVRVPKSWKHENLKAVVFVQDRGNHRVLGANALSLSK